MGNRQSWCIHSAEKSMKGDPVSDVKGKRSFSGKDCCGDNTLPVEKEPKAGIDTPMRQVNHEIVWNGDKEF